METKKITLATIKSFIRKNEDRLFINVKSSFDGMVDGCVSYNDGFVKAKKTSDNLKNTAGLSGAWFVNGSRDYFKPYNENGYNGYYISNCCGSFILATKQ